VTRPTRRHESAVRYVEMISRQELIESREALLARTVAYFSARPDVVGAFVAGSIPAGSADAYSDIDLRVVATPEGHIGLVADRLETPAHWGDLLFNEWHEGAQHCVSHFRPFLKIDVFYLSTDSFQPSPWLKFPAAIVLDRTGTVREILDRSAQLRFPPAPRSEVTRVLSKALASAHEVVRRTRRGDLLYAQSLLEELRSCMIRIDGYVHPFEPTRPRELKAEHRLSQNLRHKLNASYVDLDPLTLEAAVVGLTEILARQIPELHRSYALTRSLENDLHAAALIRDRQIA
jgi:predicted nucleotidyltransferase